ncbi:hypothetical protein MBLNU457_3500t1 [Dothideomycetes sp. NU457]
MSRPVSVASDHFAGSNGQPKAAQSKLPSTSTVSLFCANLRLLDLDLRDDWPDITPATFDTKHAQNQKRRIACVEWSLYRLFEIHDLALTKDKLAPFFPPLEPLQSLNLRAALFRCLTELKKNGVLGREAVVRKTMLDECKGDKLEEILLVFSSVVVRKKVLQRSKGKNLPFAQRLATGSIGGAQDVKKMEVLVLSHRAALAGFLQKRGEEQLKLDTLARKLLDRQHEVEERKRNVLQNRAAQEKVSAQTFEKVHKQVGDGWIGRAEDGRRLLDGNVDRETKTSDFEDFWHVASPNLSAAVNSPDNESRADLSRSLRHLESRLQRWKRLRTALSQQGRPATSGRETSRDNVRPRVIKFDKHQSIRIGAQEEVLAMPESKPATTTYDSILNAMNNALAEVGKARSKPLSRSIDAVKNTLDGNETTSYGNNPHDGRRDAALRSPPRLAPDHPNGFEKDFFSPAKRDHTPPSDDQDIPRSRDEESVDYEPIEQQELAKPARLPTVEPVDNDHTSYPASVGADLASIELSQDEPDDAHRSSAIVQAAAIQELDNEEGEADDHMVERLRQLSLTDRTRRSMGSGEEAGEDDISPVPATIDDISLPNVADTSTLSEQSETRSRMSLSDATRQSIAASMALTSQKLRQAKDNKQPQPPQYPVNQFDTPKTRQTPRQTLDKRNVTPLKDLYAQDVDYASVFKSRPKLKTSPTQSPLLERSGWLAHHGSDDGDT